MTTEPMTLRKLIARLIAQDGDSVMDLPITFMVSDGHRNITFDQMHANEWPHRRAGHIEGDYKGELRFSVHTTDYRLVKEKKR